MLSGASRGNQRGAEQSVTHLWLACSPPYAHSDEGSSSSMAAGFAVGSGGRFACVEVSLNCASPSRALGTMPMLSDSVLVIATALAACVVTEVLSWLLVYRTSSYKRVRDELDRASKKLESIKQTTTAAKPASKSNKKEKRLEENMKTSSRDLTAMRFKLGFIMSAALLFVFRAVSSAWDGHVIAKLPFSPPGFLQTVSHRGVLGNDPTDCSAVFVYALALGFFKANVAKLTGWGPSRAATRLMQSQNAFNPDKYK